MYPFLQTLLTMTATASVAALVVMVLRLPLKKAPRWIICALWLVVLLRMVCPVTFQAPVSLIPDPVAQGTYTSAFLPAETETVPVQTQATSPETVDATTAQSAPTVQPATIVFLLWAVGAGGMAFWAVVSYLRLRHQVADAVRLFDNVYETDRVDTPFVCGLFRPRVYLPAGLDPADRAYVLLHEQAHLRRRDHLTKPLGWLALCLHWFNPVLWAAYRLYCRDVETACDQAVVKHFDRTDTAGYAAALLHLGRRTSLPQAVPLAFGEENAKGRIRGVLHYKKPTFWVVLIAIVLCVLTGALLLADRPSDRFLEGVPISQAIYQASGPPHPFPGDDEAVTSRIKDVPLPDALREDLLTILNRCSHDDYILPILWYAHHRDFETVPLAGGIHELDLGDPGHNTHFYLHLLENGDGELTRITYDEDGAKAQQQAATIPGLGQRPDFQAWQTVAAAYWEEVQATLP